VRMATKLNIPTDDLTMLLRENTQRLPPAELPDLIGELTALLAASIQRLVNAPGRESPSATGPRLSLNEMAEVLRKTRIWLRRQAKRGLVPCIRTGRDFTFDRTEVEEHLKHHPEIL
jgi:excisionase family DNA binding protein